ncbi:protease-4 [Sulfuritortus calidifontis]|uniref:Protease-4 n=1 Tax=Sulfuritortus calidifontis TaxID=1914471 RepID=A0A4R3JX06_9PROT|nr:S49 family peptidase [Sulfuritortus calidifontis]TCS71466.1 protease-4 [Sulfuritortus calidifontis]
MAEGQENWERDALERLLLEQIREQRKARRWSIFFRSLLFIWLFLVLIMIAAKQDGELKPGPHTALIDIQGEIGGGDVVADDIVAALNNAFEDKRSKAVVLRINSPGGSPVAAGIIYDEIRRLRAKYPNTPVYAVVEDLCASGGYYIAAAADRIYVDKASLVGSIGVLMDGFGFTESMKKLGIERRLLTAGENKGFLDPFSPEDPKQVAHAKAMLAEIHQQFIQAVRQGRGQRLKETPELFSGLVWNGSKSIELGLADALGSLDYVAREVVQAEDILDFTPRENLADRLAKRLGSAIGEAVRPWARDQLGLR